MADHVYIENAEEHTGETATIKGWLYNFRSSGGIHFLEFRDGTGFMQGVMKRDDVDDELFERTDELKYETSVVVTGELKADERAPYLPVEMEVEDLEVVSEPTEDYPIAHKEHGVAFLMDNRHLWMRQPKQVAIARVRARVIRAIRGFFDGRGFTMVDAPIFTGSSVEGTTTLFEVDYFDDEAYLSQSGQLYMEAAAMALGKVYCFGPTFRAEKSKTRRHLTEFWMVEPEVAFLQHEGNVDLAEAFVSHIVDHVLEHCQTELDILERDVEKLEAVDQPFPRLDYEEAVQLLQDEGRDIEFGDDFGGRDETILTEQFDSPVIVERFPESLKPFYMRRDPEDESRALCVDVLAPEGYGEIIGGGEREPDLETVLANLKADDLPPEAYEWYLDLRRYGSVPHAGFGLGLERTVGWLCGREHVREMIAFPRMLNRITP
ncbi:MAG: asparagine--tRNA ligase [Bradymonadaceae bacterium]